VRKVTMQYTDLLGVGIGPFNLSLAALLSPLQSISHCFFDQNSDFNWHPGMLLPGAELQVSYLQDLVTLVDPTNAYSFIAYLAKHKRLYSFMNAQFKHVLRVEFNNYLNWVSRSIPHLHFNERVEEIQFEKDCFTTVTSQRMIQSKHLVLGNGLTPNIPDFAKPYLSSTLFHNKDFSQNKIDWQNKKVVVVGGGQSGAEIVDYILAQHTPLPTELTWITKRNHFAAMDDSTFTNELFSPQYNELFFSLSAEKKSVLLQEQTLASDGISLNLLNSIYRKLYSLEFLENKGRFFNLMTHRKLSAVHCQNNVYELTLTELEHSAAELLTADIIILCTGYKWEFPFYLGSLADKVPLHNNQFQVNQDFSIIWNGPHENRIYVQNAARHSHGIADPNLCLMAWRSAKIINSIAGQSLYDIENERAMTVNFYNRDEFQYAGL
jgi:lysine N6-hydroxylase